MGEHSPDRRLDANAVGGEGSISGAVAYGMFLARAGVSAGQLTITNEPPIQLRRGALGLWLGAWELGGELAKGPAYTSLLTTTALRPDSGSGTAITERTVSGTLGGPLFSTDVALTAEQSELSDGNRRTTMQGFIRMPLVPGISVVYSGSRVAFAKRSSRY